MDFSMRDFRFDITAFTNATDAAFITVDEDCQFREAALNQRGHLLKYEEDIWKMSTPIGKFTQEIRNVLGNTVRYIFYMTFRDAALYFYSDHRDNTNKIYFALTPDPIYIGKYQKYI